MLEVRLQVNAWRTFHDDQQAKLAAIGSKQAGQRAIRTQRMARDGKPQTV